MSAVNVPFEIPKGWAWCKISDVFSVERGGSPRPIKDYLTDSADGINWIKIADASASGKYITTVREKIRPQGLRKTKRVFVGDLLLTNSMSFGHPYILQVDGCIHDGWLVLHAFDSQLDKEFFYYLLSSRFVYVSFSITASGGVVQNLNADKVSDTSIPLPPLAEQKRIVACIEELFRVADSLGAAADGLENAAKWLDKKILDLAIRGKLVPQDPNDEPASEIVKRIAASHKSPCKNQGKPIDPPFEIPASWEWVRLKELGVFCGGHTPSTSNPKLWGGDILWVSSKDMKSKYIDDTQIKVTRLGAEELNVLKPGALLMCTRSGILRRVFPVAIARRELTINQDQRALTLWLPEMIEYVYLALKSLESIILSDYKKSGTTVESIIWNKFVDLPIPLPPLNEQKRIVKRVEALKATTRTLVTF